MNATSILSSEHRVIEQGLSCLEALASQIQAGEPLEKQTALDLISFFKNFADKCHHGKEEAHLFTVLQRYGFSSETGPVAAMLADHDLGRNHIARMLDFADDAAKGDKEARNRFVTHAMSYVLLLRAHIMKEDGILFPMADRVIGEDDQQALLVEFDRVEKEEMGEGTHEKFHAMIDELTARFGISKTNPAAAMNHGASCCHH
jgi:hemerythrin-like domain-containing protein